MFRDARAMLDRIVCGEVADREGGVRVLAGERRRRRRAACSRSGEGSTTTLHFLRQQVDKPVERPDFCLADFIAPKDSGKQDWIGAFAVTAGIGIEPHVARFEADHDDYNAILLKALADRLAEALAERLHQRVRKEFWGYDADEGARQRGADRGEIPRHPPCPGLSGLSGAQREGDAVRAARRRHATPA